MLPLIFGTPQRRSENREALLFPHKFPSHIDDGRNGSRRSRTLPHGRGAPSLAHLGHEKWGSRIAPPQARLPGRGLSRPPEPDLSIEQAVALGKERQVGIVEHPGPGYPINTDADLEHYIDRLRQFPVRVGLQPVCAGWRFSKSLLEQLDYVLMDALTLPRPDGTWWAIWQIDTMVDDEEEFMVRYMQFIEQVLTTEPIDIFAWPTFLPVPIVRQYSRLWTRPRLDRILDLARARKIAIEINEVAHVPDENFITAAKRSGLKFTFGSDSRNTRNAAHFYHC
jgi:hypothetical protein